MSNALQSTALECVSLPLWNERFTAELARIVQLPVERVDVQKDALEVRVRAEGARQSSRGTAAGRAEDGGRTGEPRLPSVTLVVRVPMQFATPGRPEADRRTGRERDCTTSKPLPDGALIKGAARAWRWQKPLHDGMSALG